MVYEPAVVGSAGPSRLVWHVRVRDARGAVNEVVLVDARLRRCRLPLLGTIKHAKNRPDLRRRQRPARSARSSAPRAGPPAASPTSNLAYEYFGDTYDFYFTRFGRDSSTARARRSSAACATASPATPARTRTPTGTGARCVSAGLRRRRRRRGPRAEPRGDRAGVEPHLLGRVRGDQRVALRHLRRVRGPGERRRRPTPGVALAHGRGPPGQRRHPQHVGPDALRRPRPAVQPNWYTATDGQPGCPHQLRRRRTSSPTCSPTAAPSTARPSPARGSPRGRGLFYEANVNLLVPASEYFDLYAVLRQAASNLGWTPAAREAARAACRAVQIDLPSNPTTILSDGFEVPAGGEVDGAAPAVPASAPGGGRSTYRKASGTASAWCAAGGASPSPAGGPTSRSRTRGWSAPSRSADDERGLGRVRPLPRCRVPGFDEVFWGSTSPPTARLRRLRRLAGTRRTAHHNGVGRPFPTWTATRRSSASRRSDRSRRRVAGVVRDPVRLRRHRRSTRAPTWTTWSSRRARPRRRSASFDTPAPTVDRRDRRHPGDRLGAGRRRGDERQDLPRAAGRRADPAEREGVHR